MGDEDVGRSEGKRRRSELNSEIEDAQGREIGKRLKRKQKFISRDIPSTDHYHVSWMHAGVVTAVVTSLKHGYVITGSADGIVKFWKRLQVVGLDVAGGSVDQRPCLEFVKSFTAHTGAVQSLSIDQENSDESETGSGGDTCCSVGSDGLLKFYDVSTFDALTMIPTGKKLGTASCWFREPSSAVKVFCVSAADSGSIYLYDTDGLALLQTMTLHGDNRVTCLLSLPRYDCVVSTDSKGIVEMWSTVNSASGTATSLDENDDEYDSKGSSLSFRVGAACNSSRNAVTFKSKLDTDLYALVKKKTFCIAAAANPTGSHFALYAADNKIRIYKYSSAKVLVTFDERLDKVYDKVFSNYGLDSIEYGRRAALEREMMQESNVFSAGMSLSQQQHQTKSSRDKSPPQRLSIQFDPSGKYLLIPTLIGIKVIDWQRHKLVRVIGSADASQFRFISICLASGDPKVNRQMQLARKGTTKTSADVEAAAMGGDGATVDQSSDALLIALAYSKHRVFVFSHIDPLLGDTDEASDEAHASRDVWNEAPTTEDKVHTNAARSLRDKSSNLATKAILRTTKGDIHVQLFASQVSKTIENFVGHSKSGYYDNVIFHRVIKGFMLQTGDPLGDGTGGECIWGGEFEDEFVPGLRHDRPFTVSMANAGPNTNGSQFFITTVPTSWLDNKHTVFGRVVQGMDVCTLIENVKTDDLDKPLEEIRILNVDVE